MADATIRGWGFTANNGTTSITIMGTPPASGSAPSVGDWLVVGLVDTTTTSTTPGTGAPTTSVSGWTTLVPRTKQGTRSVTWLARRVQSGESSYTFTFGGASYVNSLAIWGPGGVVSPGSWQSSALTVGSSTGTTTTTPTLATSTKSLVLALFGLASSTSGQTDAQNTINSPYTKGAWTANWTTTVINELFFGYQAQAAAATAPAAVHTHSGASTTTNSSGFLLAIPTVADPVALTVTTPAEGATVTNARTPFVGTASVGATVYLTNGNSVDLGNATTDSSGNWSITPTSNLTAGQSVYNIAAVLGSNNAVPVNRTVTYTPPAATHLAGQYFDGTNLKTGYFKYYNGSAESELTKAVTVWPGRKVHEFFLQTTPPVIAHRLGSLNFLEHTLRGATQSAIAKVDALEISVAVSSDGVFFGLHDASLDRTTNNTGGGTGTSLVAANMTWAQIQGYSQAYPVGNDATYGNRTDSYYRLTDLIDPYYKTHTIFIDPKVLTASQRLSLYTLLQSYSGYKDTFVGKYYHTGTNVALEFSSRGMKTWGYGYQADADGTGATQMSTTVGSWDWLGMDYTANATAWANVVALGKPVIGHICPTYAAAQTAIGFGASGIMASGVNEVTTGRLLAAAQLVNYQENFGTVGALPTTYWNQVLNGGTATVTAAGAMLLKPDAVGYHQANITYARPGTLPDQEVFGSVTLPDTTEKFLTLSLRGPSSTTTYNPIGYQLVFNPTNTGNNVYLNVGAADGSYAYSPDLLVRSTAMTLVAAKYNYRFALVGTLLRAKVWLSTDPEPVRYMWEALIDTQTNYQSTGYFSAQVISGNGTNTGFTLGPITFSKPKYPQHYHLPPADRASVTSNGHTYTLKYLEDFNQPAAIGSVRTQYGKMGYYDGFTDTSKLGLNAPDKVLSVHDGVLDVWLHSENGQPLVSTVLPDNYAPHTHGRFSVRMWTDVAAKGTGYKLVPLLWPTSNDWNQGEVDWPETDIGGYPSPASAVPGTLQYDEGTNSSSMTFLPTKVYPAWATTAGWHVYTTQWDTEGLYFYMDGELVASITDQSKLPTNPMRYTLQFETWIGEGAVPTSTSTHVLVDWVAIWD